MKQAQNARNKQRGRSPVRKGGGKPGGPGNTRNEPKVRGNPKQLLEKYKNQARESKQAGDRVMAEYYYQFADHYQRVLNEVRGPSPQVDYDEDGNEIEDNRDAGQEGGRHDGRNDNNNNRRNGRGRGRGNNRDQDNGNDDGSDRPERSERTERPERGERTERSDDGEARQPRRARGGRRPRDPEAPAADPAKSEQPVEVHPELDLDGQVVTANAEVGEKPKRRRAAPATPRKRAPRAKKEADAEAPSDSSSPEDNAAA